MDHVICINQNSFPAENPEVGFQLFDDAVQGVLQLQADSDRFLFYLDSNSGCLFDFEIAVDFTYQQFIDRCGDADLALFLSEVEDKSPALDNLSEEQMEDMAAYSFYVLNEAADNYPDVYALAWTVSGFLLSIATHARWDRSEINIARADELGRFVTEILTLKNISTLNHGIEHYQELNQIDLEKLVSPHFISQHLLSWVSEQTSENKKIIYDKLRLACNRQFQGGEPLFKTLTNCDGLREIRTSAYSGGAIRILFKNFDQQKQALLVGFIKHSDNEGYAQATKQANEVYSRLPTVH